MEKLFSGYSQLSSQRLLDLNVEVSATPSYSGLEIPSMLEVQMTVVGFTLTTTSPGAIYVFFITNPPF
jgi:hypothetical protein